MSKKILVIGDEHRIKAFKDCFEGISGFDIEISDGDEEEDFDLYDLIADLNFDDNDENMEIYAELKDKLILVGAVKQSLSESVYKINTKLKCKLFGINALPIFLATKQWEISAYRYPEYEALENFFGNNLIQLVKVADRVGMLRPRLDFVGMNETATCMQEQIVMHQEGQEKILHPYLENIDKHGITEVFETLMALYEDTKEDRYKPSPLLKTRYLRNQSFIKKPKA